MTDTTLRTVEEQMTNGETIYSHDGILLKYANAEFITELNTSGSLNLVEYPKKRHFIEWHPSDSILILDDEIQDQDEWSLVDTISRRQRTTSESRVFNVKCDSPARSQCLKVELSTLRSIEVMSKGHVIRLLKKDNGTAHSEYLFQNGNADLFVRALQKLQLLEQVRNKKHVFEILDSEEAKLQKTFAELNIDDIKNSGGWLSNIVWRNIDFLAKVSYYTQTPTSLVQNPESPNKNDDYEILSEERSDGESSSPNISHNENLEKFNRLNKSEKFFPNGGLPRRKSIPRGTPLTEKQWREFQTEDGRISDSQRTKEIIFRGGIEEKIRFEVWKYLLDYYLWDENTEQREQRIKNKTTEYYQMKAQWLSMSTAQEKNFSGFRDRKCQIEKDVKRTDRSQEFFAGDENPNLIILQDILMTYVMYDFDLGYVQGMSDLLAPLLSVLKNEVDTFWCFVGFMHKVFSNFDIDQAGMKRQLSYLNRLIEFCNPKLFYYLKDHGSDNMYFCFRWLLVWFKREFSINDIETLWECLWTDLPCPNYHLFISLAILDIEMDTIIVNKYEFNEILKHINELSMKIDLKKILELAESIYEQLKSFENLPKEIQLIIGKINDIKNFGSNDSLEYYNKTNENQVNFKENKLEEDCDRSMSLTFL